MVLNPSDQPKTPVPARKLLRRQNSKHHQDMLSIATPLIRGILLAQRHLEEDGGEMLC
jgi:hypothetical protein